MKTAVDPRKLLDQRSEELHLSPRFRSLLEPFLRAAIDRLLTQPLAA
jgi:hypothetical protein